MNLLTKIKIKNIEEALFLVSLVKKKSYHNFPDEALLDVFREIPDVNKTEAAY